MRTSTDSWQAEWASLESCGSASSAHGTDRTEAQRLRLVSCVATSNFIRSLGMGVVPARLHLAALLRKCERLQIGGRQKGLAWKAVAQPHLPWHCSHKGTETEAALLSCHLQRQTYAGNGGGPCQAPSCTPSPKMRTSADSWQTEGSSLESCCSASPVHGTARTEAQRLGLFTCLST